MPPEDEDGIETPYRLWSDWTSWGDAGVPEEGADVVIEPSWNMLLDIVDPPKLNSLTINGRLTFKPDVGDIVLQSKTIWVFTGQFYIGTEEEPFPNVAKIVLLGL